MMFIGPACMLNMDRVGVMLTSVTVAEPLPILSCPIQLNVVPSTRIFPDHPMIDCVRDVWARRSPAAVKRHSLADPRSAAMNLTMVRRCSY